MSVRVVRPGMLTTVQDLGRHGLQHLGIVPCGAMDPVAHRIANALVGNPLDDGHARMHGAGSGTDLRPRLPHCDVWRGIRSKAWGEPFPMNRPVLVSAGSALACGAAVRGARAYLAMAGGFGVPEVLGSRSTYVPAGFGGLSGRAS